MDDVLDSILAELIGSGWSILRRKPIIAYQPDTNHVVRIELKEKEGRIFIWDDPVIVNVEDERSLEAFMNLVEKRARPLPKANKDMRSFQLLALALTGDLPDHNVFRYRGFLVSFDGGMLKAKREGYGYILTLPYQRGSLPDLVAANLAARLNEKIKKALKREEIFSKAPELKRRTFLSILKEVARVRGLPLQRIDDTRYDLNGHVFNLSKIKLTKDDESVLIEGLSMEMSYRDLKAILEAHWKDTLKRFIETMLENGGKK